MMQLNTMGQKRYVVHFGDISNERYIEMLDYCQENKLSLVKTETCNLDVSDVSGRYDTIAIFRFEKEADALIFKLRF
jgi:uncharacterized protein YfcZ (UPF0381/DUF406 family)